MPTNFPTGLDAYQRPVTGDPRAAPVRETVVVDNAYDAIEALEDVLVGPMLINVKGRAFGAVGNGVTDDTAAIQAALDYAAANGGVVIVPPGNYVVSATLDFVTSGDVQGLVLCGAGIRETVFDNRVANGPLLNIDGSATPNQRAFGTHLSDFSITTTTSPVVSRGIDLHGLYLASIERVRIQGLSSDGIRIVNDTGDSDTVHFLRLFQLWIFGNGGWGINQTIPTPGQGSATGGWNFDQIYVNANVLGGIHCTALTSEIANSTIANSTSGPGIHYEYETNAQPSEAFLHNCHFDSNDTYDIDFEAITNALVLQCQFVFTATGPSGAAVRVGRSGGTTSIVGAVLLDQCHFRNNTAGTVVGIEAKSNVSGGTTPQGFVAMRDWWFASAGGGGFTEIAAEDAATSALCLLEKRGVSYGLTTSDYPLTVATDSDATFRVRLRAQGNVEWASGAAAADCVLTRSGAANMRWNNTAITAAAAATGNTARAIIVTGEAVSRHIEIGTGEHQWGDGTNPVDTTLGRLAANILGTGAGDKLVANGGLGVGNSAAATTPGTVTDKMEVFDASGASLGFVAIYDAIT